MQIHKDGYNDENDDNDHMMMEMMMKLRIKMVKVMMVVDAASIYLLLSTF